MKQLIGFIFMFLFTALPLFAQNGATNPAQAWWSHIQFLAEDKMAGRDTGSAEQRRAVDYVAAAFQRAGLKPAGTKGYLQPVNLSLIPCQLFIGCTERWRCIQGTRNN